MSVGVGEVEGGRFVGKTIGKLVDRNNQTVKTEMFPVFTQDRERRLLFFFTPLQAGEDGERYRLTVQQRLDGIMPFRNKRDDITYIGEPAKGTVERVELVLLLPKDHVDVQLSPLSAQYPGRAMTEPELNAHNDHPSYRPHGWVGENIPPGERFGMLILASQ